MILMPSKKESSELSPLEVYDYIVRKGIGKTSSGEDPLKDAYLAALSNHRIQVAQNKDVARYINPMHYFHNIVSEYKRTEKEQ